MADSRLFPHDLLCARARLHAVAVPLQCATHEHLGGERKGGRHRRPVARDRQRQYNRIRRGRRGRMAGRAMRARGRFGIASLLLALLRRLLYLAVRTQVTPDRAADLALDPARPVCYVLQDRHLSSVLVLDAEAQRLGLPSPVARMAAPFSAEKRSVFSVILNPNPLSLRQADPSETLERLTQALIADPALDVQLVPVTVIWSRAPGSQD
jgi:hypothetical protein